MSVTALTFLLWYYGSFWPGVPPVTEGRFTLRQVGATQNCRWIGCTAWYPVQAYSSGRRCMAHGTVSTALLAQSAAMRQPISCWEFC